MKIPCLSLTLGQQGGIDNPPVIVRLRGRWYAVIDSRDTRPPAELAERLDYQQRRKSPYDHSPDPYWHPQGWVWRKWNNAQEITWAELERMVDKHGSKIDQKSR